MAVLPNYMLIKLLRGNCCEKDCWKLLVVVWSLVRIHEDTNQMLTSKYLAIQMPKITTE